MTTSHDDWPLARVTIRQLRERLAGCAPDAKVTAGVDEPHSWRGVYAEPAVEPALGVTVGTMKVALDRLLTESFEGWKGGTYSYAEDDELHLSVTGSAIEYSWAPVFAAIDAIDA